MPTTTHSNLVSPDAIHPAAYVGTSDPGAVGANKFWVSTSTGPPYNLFKRNLANTGWEQIGASTTGSAELSATDFRATGLPGANFVSRYVGSQPSVAPTSGTFALGDFIVTQNGSFYICTVAGSPGTWVQVIASPVHTGEVTGTDFAPVGLTGANASTRYVGGTASVAPTTGTFALGDYVITQTGSLYICTAGGSPGTWVQVSGGGGGGGGSIVAASNLIQETQILTAGVTTTINIPNIPQNYRTLIIDIDARSDATGVSNTTLGIRANGDATVGNYDHQIEYLSNNAVNGNLATGTASSAQCVTVTGATAPASVSNTTRVYIHDYTNTSFQKVFNAWGSFKNAASTGNLGPAIGAGFWRISNQPITSLDLILTAGFFTVGSVIRVYGDPASAAGSALGTGTRLRLSANQLMSSAVATAVTWDVEDSDPDNQHFVSAANLTGTLTKTSGTTSVTGSGTLFQSELVVGQVISIAGTSNEKRVVTAIASNTALTVNLPFVNSGAGQVAARINSAVVFRSPGFYTLETNLYSSSLISGITTLALMLNSLTTITSGTAIGQRDVAAVNAGAGYSLATQRYFNQWDFVEVMWQQNSGGPIAVFADERTHFSISSRPTVIVAIPYVNVQDQKAQNTSGGAFNSGAWRTRTLTTIVTDTGSIASLASSQITLPPGTYRCSIRPTVYQVNQHQARLQNITLGTTILLGQSGQSGGAQNNSGFSYVGGRFTLTAPAALEVQHQCNTTNGTNGFGVAANFGTEVYTIAEFWKEG